MLSRSNLKKVLKHAYLSVPLKSVFSVVRKISHPNKKIYWYLRFKDNFTVPIDAEHSFQIRSHGASIENSIFWTGLNGEWEAVSMNLWIQLARQANVIFDIGANTGVYSLVAKSLNSTATIFAFEPVERIFEKLEYNNRLNNYSIVCVNYAASNADGTATIYDLPDDHIYSVTVNKNLNPDRVEVIPTTIKTLRLDTFIKQQNIQAIDLIKLDVETHEAEVLEGLGHYLEKFKPTMLIEVLNDEVGGKIEELISGKGYLYFNLDEESGSIKLVPRITKSDYYNFLICNESIAKSLKLIN